MSIGPLLTYLTGKSVRTPMRDLRRARDLFLRTREWPDVSQISGPCILIADAIHVRTGTYLAVAHVILLASADDDRAWILPVHVDSRGENAETWRAAFDAALTPEMRSKVKGLACDGKIGLLRCARIEGWVVQRCQFHLIARLQIKRSKSALSRHRREGVMLYELAKAVMTARSQHVCDQAVEKLTLIARAETNKYVKRIVSGLTKHYRDYRTYLRHPDLRFPQTTNVVESVNSLIRSLLHRMRGVRSREAARLWIEALLKQRRFMRLKRHTIS